MTRGWGWEVWFSAAALTLAPAAAHANSCKVNMLAELPVTMQGRRATVPVRINNHPTVFWLDTGAFFSTMSQAKAAELELTVKPIVGMELRIMGIGGSAEAQVARVRSFGLAKSDLNDVDFIVGGSDSGNALIGANILAVRDTEFDLAHGSVKLADARDCHGVNLAYWAPGQQVFVAQLNLDPPGRLHEFHIPLTINGARIVAEIDTGAPQSLMSRHAAERAKIDIKDSSAVPIRGIGGFGRRTLSGWSVPVENVGIGDEHVLKTRIDVIDGPIIKGDTEDMLLGADWVLAHHIYIARREGLMFFTYSGGRPFVASEAEPADVTTASKAPGSPLPTGMHVVSAIGDTEAEPTTADAFGRRGSVRLMRRAFGVAIADFTRAIHLEPGESAYYRERAQAYAESGQLPLARVDLDKAIALEPKDASLIVERARLRLSDKDRMGALADLDAAAKVASSSSLVAAEIAQLYAPAGKPERAVALFGPVIAVHADDSRLGALLNGRCWARALANVELAGALDDCNRAIKRFGANPAFLDSRGLVRYRQGNLSGALTDYDAALKGEPRMAWSLFMRGAAKAKQGDAVGSKTDQDAARALKPDIADEAARYGLP